MKISDWQKKPYDQVLHLTKSVTRELKRLPVIDGCVFKPRFGDSPHISVESLPTAFWKIGYKGVAVPHGWRSSLKTMAEDSFDEDERPLFAPSWVEAVLDHAPPGISSHYQRGKAERGMKRVLWWWSDLLDESLRKHEQSVLIPAPLLFRHLSLPGLALLVCQKFGQKHHQMPGYLGG